MKTIIPLITVLAVCVTTAVVVTVGLRNKSLATTDATLDLTSQAPLVPPAHTHLRGVSAARASTLVSRGADAARGQAKQADPKPAKVVGGGRDRAQDQGPDQRRPAPRRRARGRAPDDDLPDRDLQRPRQPAHGTRAATTRGTRRPRAQRPAPSPASGSFGVDILGTQELQPDQLNALQAMTGYAAYPGYAFGSRETDNSILYDDSRFEFVSGSSFTIHFMHANRPQTILRLRDKETGREFYVLNMHASAGFGGYAVTRRAGHYTAAATVNRLKAEGIPIFLTGDMNDRAEFFCRVAPATGMVAAIGGSISGGCHPAGALAVDWVMGWGNVQLQQLHRGPQHHADDSDHYFVSATATAGPMS